MFDHIPIAISIELICWLIGWSLGAPTIASVWIGCFSGAAVCVMREITQHEYRWIEKRGQGHRANMPSYVGLMFWRWNRHSLLETALAVMAAVIAALAAAIL